MCGTIQIPFPQHPVPPADLVSVYLTGIANMAMEMNQTVNRVFVVLKVVLLLVLIVLNLLIYVHHVLLLPVLLPME